MSKHFKRIDQLLERVVGLFACRKVCRVIAKEQIWTDVGKYIGDFV